MKKLLFLWYLALAAVAVGQTKISELPALTGSGAVSTDIVPIVDVSAGAAGSKKITLAELFSTPVPWQGVVITGQYGGTGVANTGKTITLGGNFTTSGANAVTLTTSGATNVTLPTTGTLATATAVDLKADADGGNVNTAAEMGGLRAALGMPIRVTDYGAVGDAMLLHDAVIVSADNTVTSATATFPVDIAGKYCRVAGGTTAGVHQVETATAAGTIDVTTGTYGTLSVTVTGTGIAGTPVSFSVNVAEGDTAATWAGKVRGYLTNALNLFDLYYVGGSSTSITLTGKRPRANDPDLNIHIATGSNLTSFTTIASSANTTAGVATVDLITTVASRNSATSIELTGAPGRSGSDVTIYYGTDNTAAYEVAQDAAESTGAREVQWPEPAEGGCYLGNVVGRPNISLVGAAGGMTEVEFDIGGSEGLPDLSNRDKIPVVLIPAVATEPVIKYSTAGKIYGAGVKRLAIFGSKEQVGYGIQLGEPDAASNGFTANGFRLEQVLVTGFEYGVSSSRVSQIQADTCFFGYSRVCVFLGELTFGEGPTDTSVFNACGTGGANCDANWVINYCKGITINGGDHNDGDHVLVAGGGSTVVLNGINAEQIASSPFQLYTANVKVVESNILHLYGPLSDAIGSGNAFSFSGRIGTATAPAQWEGVNIGCRTDQPGFTPESLPRGMVVARYQDLGWNTLMQTEYTSRLYETAEAVRRQPRLIDEFCDYSVNGSAIRGKVTDIAGGGSQKIVYSSLGWELTTLAGATANVTAMSQPANPGNSLGVFGVGFTTTTSTNVGRFGLPDEVINPTAQYWEMRWVLKYDHASGIIRFRSGAYSITGTILPTDGIGIHVDAAAAANIQFEVINGGSRTAVDTGIPYTELTSTREIVITRTPQGLFFKLRSAPNASQGMANYPQVKHTQSAAIGDYITPCCILGMSSSGWPYYVLDRFSLEMFDSF